MNEAFPIILLTIAIFFLLLFCVLNRESFKQHRDNSEIHFQKKEIPEKEKLEIEILKERLKQLREGTGKP